MKTVAAFVLASSIASAANAATPFSSNSSAEAATFGFSTVRQVQQFDNSRLTLLAGPRITSAPSGYLPSGAIPAINSADSQIFLYKFRGPAFESRTTEAGVRRMRARVMPHQAAREFTAPVSPSKPTSLQSDLPVLAWPITLTPLEQTSLGTSIQRAVY